MNCEETAAFVLIRAFWEVSWAFFLVFFANISLISFCKSASLDLKKVFETGFFVRVLFNPDSGFYLSFISRRKFWVKNVMFLTFETVFSLTQIFQNIRLLL